MGSWNFGSSGSREQLEGDIDAQRAAQEDGLSPEARAHMAATGEYLKAILAMTPDEHGVSVSASGQRYEDGTFSASISISAYRRLHPVDVDDEASAEAYEAEAGEAVELD